MSTLVSYNLYYVKWKDSENEGFRLGADLQCSPFWFLADGGETNLFSIEKTQNFRRQFIPQLIPPPIKITRTSIVLNNAFAPGSNIPYEAN